MRLLTWNLEWAKLSSWRVRHILDRIRAEAPDVAVLTEAQLPFARELFEHVVDAGPHPSARQPQGSKVVVVSTRPLVTVDLVGSDALPQRNFVAVDVEDSDLGMLRVLGVVVRWKEKRAYIDALVDELPLIDHIAVSSGLHASDVRVWGRHVGGEARRITDHAGASVELTTS